MKLIIVRHGETEANVKGVLQGEEGPLTKNGLEQAKKLARRLKGEKIDVIFSSDSRRAIQTSEEIGKFHKVPIEYTAELRELSAGSFCGETWEELRKARMESGLRREEYKPEGGESYLELIGRVGKFLERLYRDYKGKTVLISAHGGTNKALLNLLLETSIEEALKIEQNNTCVNVLVQENGKHKAEFVNCTKHLWRKTNR